MCHTDTEIFVYEFKKVFRRRFNEKTRDLSQLQRTNRKCTKRNSFVVGFIHFVKYSTTALYGEMCETRGSVCSIRIAGGEVGRGHDDNEKINEYGEQQGLKIGKCNLCKCLVYEEVWQVDSPGRSNLKIKLRKEYNILLMLHTVSL